MHTKLEAARLPIELKFYDTKELDSLPSPVQRYFRAALSAGQRMISAISIEQSGTLNKRESGERW